MKKIFLVLFVGVIISLTGCDHAPTESGGSGLPSGWDIACKSSPNISFYNWQVGNTVTFYIEIYDEHSAVVSSSDYDTSSTTWVVEPAGIATLSDSTGTITHVTAIQDGNFQLIAKFKGTTFYRPVVINP